MFDVAGTRIKSLYQGEGSEFTGLIDDILRSSALSCGLGTGAVHANQQTNRPDGGVDTRIVDSFGDQERTGWARVPSIFQYKAQPGSAITSASMRAEVSKPYAAERVRAGDVYCIFVADTLTSQEIDSKESELNSILQTLYGLAKPGRVIDCNQIAAALRLFPWLVLRRFHPIRDASLLSIGPWADMVASKLKNFVDIPQREPVFSRIVEHVTFDPKELPVNGVIAVVGAAGVGKTRLVYEAVVKSGCADYLVAYTDDQDKAQEVVKSLLHDDGETAVLVADECGPEAIDRLYRLLEGEARCRIRVVAIQRPSDRTASIAPEYVLADLRED